jgi:hypothetical protein
MDLQKASATTIRAITANQKTVAARSIIATVSKSEGMFAMGRKLT